MLSRGPAGCEAGARRGAAGADGDSLRGGPRLPAGAGAGRVHRPGGEKPPAGGEPGPHRGLVRGAAGRAGGAGGLAGRPPSAGPAAGRRQDLGAAGGRRQGGALRQGTRGRAGREDGACRACGAAPSRRGTGEGEEKRPGPSSRPPPQERLRREVAELRGGLGAWHGARGRAERRLPRAFPPPPSPPPSRLGELLGAGWVLPGVPVPCPRRLCCGVRASVGRAPASRSWRVRAAPALLAAIPSVTQRGADEKARPRLCLCLSHDLG